MAKTKIQRCRSAVEKELKAVKKQEEALLKAAGRQEAPRWKQTLEEKIPEGVYQNLQKAFGKAFSIIFTKGTGIIEKSFHREAIQEDHQVQSFAFQVKASQKALKRVRGSAGAANRMNLAVTAAEGIGLGIFGIGLPDIVIFVGVLLKGVYETALHYGFDYTSDGERYFILKLMETAMLKGEVWIDSNAHIDQLIDEGISKEHQTDNIDQQIHETASAFAMDMVFMKFVQGLPVIGIIGGAGNPMYYSRVIKYVELKYRKRYLLNIQKRLEEEELCRCNYESP
ncbi:MAG: EcsC family protein [Lachnospiraceae bacterium]|nr:EcsC family protein [Lachnospiraceae bacterium]